MDNLEELMKEPNDFLDKDVNIFYEDPVLIKKNRDLTRSVEEQRCEIRDLKFTILAKDDQIDDLTIGVKSFLTVIVIYSLFVIFGVLILTECNSHSIIHLFIKFSILIGITFGGLFVYHKIRMLLIDNC